MTRLSGSALPLPSALAPQQGSAASAARRPSRSRSRKASGGQSFARSTRSTASSGPATGTMKRKRSSSPPRSIADGDELQAGLAVGEDVAGGGRAGGDAAGHPAGGKEGVARGVGLGVEPFVEAPGGFARREVIGVGDDGEVDRDVGRGVGDLDPDRLDTAGVERDAEDPGVGRGVGDSDTDGDGALALLANLGAGRRVRRGERGRGEDQEDAGGGEPSGEARGAAHGSSVTLIEVLPEATRSIPAWNSASGIRWVTISSIGRRPSSIMRIATG